MLDAPQRPGPDRPAPQRPAPDRADRSAVSGRLLLGYGVGRLVPGLLTLVSIPLWLRATGSAEYATFTLVWVLTFVTTSVSVGWIAQAALRAAGDPERALRRLPRGPLVAAVALPVVPVAVWVVTTAPGPSAGLVGAAAAFCVATGVYTLAATRAQRDQRSTRYAVAESVRTAVSLAAALWFVQHVDGHLGGHLGGAAALLAGNTLGTVAGAAVLLGPAAPTGALAAATSRAVLRSYWRYGWPMSLWFAASILLVYVDRFVVASLLGPAAAGRYAAIADTITRGMGMLAFPITVAVHAAVMNAWNTGRRDRAAATLAAAARLLAAVLGGCVVAAAVIGPWALGILLPGPAPPRSTIVLLAVGAALWQCALLAHKTLEIAGRSRLMLCLMLAATAVTFGLDVVLVPVAGLTGAAAAFALGAAGYTVSCLLIGPGVLRRHAAAAKLPAGKGPVAS